MQASRPDVDVVLDTTGMLCPQPIIEIQEKVRGLGPGAVVELVSDDVGILADLPAWCGGTGHELLGLEELAPGRWHGYVKVRRVSS